MSLNLVLVPAHGFVLLNTVATFGINLWAGFGVGSARKKYDVPYPTMYADATNKNHKIFNCYQRAHQNVLENIPLYLAMQLTGAILRPEIAAVCGLIRNLGFIFYVKGYQTGDPKKREWGVFGHLGMFALVGLTVEVAVRLLMAY